MQSMGNMQQILTTTYVIIWLHYHGDAPQNTISFLFLFLNQVYTIYKIFYTIYLNLKTKKIVRASYKWRYFNNWYIYDLRCT